MKNFFKSVTLAEWLIWGVSIVAVTVSFFVFGNVQYHYLAASLIGVTALMLVSKGNPAGQLLTVVFSVFYGVIAYSFAYYGEIITYIGMSAPMAVWALVVWLKNPYKGNKCEVKVNSLSRREWACFSVAAVAVTVIFYFVLRALHTANIIVSTVSVLTSFSASYLTARRSRFYALCYGVNDLVLIAMWALASVEDLTYLPMAVCFAAFFVADAYGFVNWTVINRKQRGSDN